LELQRLLQENFGAIVEEWVSALKSSETKYRSRPREELRQTVGKNLTAVIQSLTEADDGALREFVDEIARFRSGLGFNLAEIQQAFLTGKETLQRWIDRYFPQGQAYEATKALDSLFSRTVIEFTKVYEKLQIEEAEERSRRLAQAEEEAKFLHKLRDENEKFDGIIQTIGGGLSLIDKNMRIIWANSAFAREFGPLGHILGRTCYETYWQDGRSCEGCVHRRVFESGRIERGVREYTDARGRYHYYQLIAAPITNERGEVEQVLEFIQDITHIKQLQDKASAQERFLLAITTNSADAIVGLDAEDVVTFWNNGAEKIFGYRAEEIVGKPFEILLPPDLREKREMEYIRRHIEERGYLRNYQTIHLAKDGRSVPVEVTRTALRDEAGRYVGSSAILRDITERKQLEEQLLHAERLASIGRMAAKVAHEIRSPLSSISLNAELLQDEVGRFSNGQTEEAECLLTSIISEVDRLASLTEEYLQFSRLPEARFELSDVNRLIESVLNFVSEECASHGVAVHAELDKRIPPLFLDKKQLRQACLNLFKNALEAMPDGGRLDVVTRLGRNAVEIEVRDTGEGIRPEDIGRIFDPFFTTKDVGTGLGLPLTKQIIHEHGGQITCESIVNQGTTFTITLPLRLDDQEREVS